MHTPHKMCTLHHTHVLPSRCLQSFLNQQRFFARQFALIKASLFFKLMTLETVWLFHELTAAVTCIGYISALTAQGTGPMPGENAARYSISAPMISQL